MKLIYIESWYEIWSDVGANVDWGVYRCLTVKYNGSVITENVQCHWKN